MSSVMTAGFRDGPSWAFEMPSAGWKIAGTGQRQTPNTLGFANFCRIVLDQLPPPAGEALLT